MSQEGQGGEWPSKYGGQEPDCWLGLRQAYLSTGNTELLGWALQQDCPEGQTVSLA